VEQVVPVAVPPLLAEEAAAALLAAHTVMGLQVAAEAILHPLVAEEAAEQEARLSRFLHLRLRLAQVLQVV
jgi:hypothetical protein